MQASTLCGTGHTNDVKSECVAGYTTEAERVAGYPPWRQPRGRWMVSLVNSHTNATRIGWHMWEIDFRFAPGLPPGWNGGTGTKGIGGFVGKNGKRGPRGPEGVRGPVGPKGAKVLPFFFITLKPRVK